MSFKMIYRCIRCRKPLRDDGTCQNDNCVRYVDENDTKDKDEAKVGGAATSAEAASAAMDDKA